MGRVDANVGPPIGGRVRTIPVVSGQKVARGAVLVTNRERRSRQAQLQTAESRLATLGLAASGGGQGFALVAPISGTVLQVTPASVNRSGQKTPSLCWAKATKSG